MSKNDSSSLWILVMYARRKCAHLPSWIYLFMENNIKTKPFTGSGLVSILLWELTTGSSGQVTPFPEKSNSLKLVWSLLL